MDLWGCPETPGSLRQQGNTSGFAMLMTLRRTTAIAEMYAVAESSPRAAVFPEYLISFGEYFWISKYYDDSIVSTADFVYGHPYISRVFVNRLEIAKNLFKDLRVTSGFAYEDYLFNCEMRASGMQFRIASKTILFYRQRKGSLLRQANAASIGQIPHCSLFSPLDFSARVAQDAEWNTTSRQPRYQECGARCRSCSRNCF